MTKTFNRALRKINRKIDSKGGYNKENQSDRKTESSFKRNRIIQCHECQEFGHIQVECANTLKRQNKSYNTTLSDEESDDSSDEEKEENNNTFIVFNNTVEKSCSKENDGHLQVKYESEDEEYTNETVKESLEKLQSRLIVVVNIN